MASLRKQLEEAQESLSRQQQLRDAQREEYQKIVAGLIATIRRSNEKILADTFRIEELNQQVSIQQKMVAEAKDDATSAIRSRKDIAELYKVCLDSRLELLDELCIAKEDLRLARRPWWRKLLDSVKEWWDDVG